MLSMLRYHYLASNYSVVNILPLNFLAHLKRVYGYISACVIVYAIGTGCIVQMKDNANCTHLLTFSKKFRTTFQWSDDEEETKRVVRSARDKRYGGMRDIIKNVKNHKKIKDMANILSGRRSHNIQCCK